MRIGQLTALAALAGLVACKDSNAPIALGPIASAIIQGQNQTVTAKPDTRLPEPVVDQLVRMPSGQLVLRRVPAWERVFLPRLAYAQTVVKGSPVPGAVVCAQEGVQLVPFSRCVNTDSAGKATFYFTYGTKAGRQRTEIRGTLKDLPVVFDTVIATVKPDSFADSPLLHGTTWPGRYVPATFPPEVAVDQYGNPVPYRFVVLPDAYGESWTDTLGRSRLTTGFRMYARTQNDTLGTSGARTILIDSIGGPDTIGGFNVTNICGTVQVVTATGVRVLGTYRTQKVTPPNAREFSLGPHVDLSTRTTCPL